MEDPGTSSKRHYETSLEVFNVEGAKKSYESDRRQTQRNSHVSSDWDGTETHTGVDFCKVSVTLNAVRDE